MPKWPEGNVQRTGAHRICREERLDALEAGLFRDGYMLDLKLIKGGTVYSRPGPPGHCIAVQDGGGASLVGQRLAQHCRVPAGKHSPGLTTLVAG